MYFPFASRQGRIVISIAGVILVVTSILGFWVVSELRGAAIANDLRPAIWGRTLENISKKPFTGVGFGREIYKSEYMPLSRSGEGLTHAHNIFLSYADQMGIQGSLTLAILFAAFILKFVRFSRFNDASAKAVGISGAALIVGTVAKGMTDMHFAREVTLFFWAIIGVLLGFGERVVRS